MAPIQPKAPAPPPGKLTDRLREEAEADPYELIERGLRALIVVGSAKDKVMAQIREYADIAAETQRVLNERIRPRAKK